MFDVLVNILDGSMWVGGVVAALFLLDVQIPSWFRLTLLTRRTAFQRAVPFFLAGCILLGARILYFEKGVMRAVCVWRLVSPPCQAYSGFTGLIVHDGSPIHL